MPKGLINVVQASREDGPATTEALIAHRAIRKVAFTGSTAVGRIIGQTASKYLKPVLMELGGKAPAMVLKDADVKVAADDIIYGAFLHHGQICMSTDRMVVVQELADELVQEMKVAIKANFLTERVTRVARGWPRELTISYKRLTLQELASLSVMEVLMQMAPV